MPVIKLSNVYKIANNDGLFVNILDNINLEISPNETVAICAPTSSGKSSLISIIGAISTPTKGTVLIDGVDIESLSRREQVLLRRHSIGFIMPTHNILPFYNCIDNVAYILKLQKHKKEKREKIARSALQLLGLEEIQHLKKSQLSHLQRKQVAFARAITYNPKIIVVDEIENNLHKSDAKKLIATMVGKKYTGEAAIVYSTTSVSLAMMADRMICLENGSISYDGDPTPIIN